MNAISTSLVDVLEMSDCSPLGCPNLCTPQARQHVRGQPHSYGLASHTEEAYGIKLKQVTFPVLFSHM